MPTLLLPHEVDRLYRYRFGHAERLAKRGILPHLKLPDGQIRFDADEVRKALQAVPAAIARTGVADAATVH